uniref:RAB11 family interacting protein 1 n=1 Tax=Leptobrachium leishanense TaxID=445787 RepID=A0A8C5WCZ2_9ANUR
MSLAQQSQTWFPTHVQVTVLQAKSLRSKGKSGTNDAYAIIQLGKEKYSTTVAEKSASPVWKEEATFEVPLLHNDNQERCTVRVIVMHRALVGMDKFLGQMELNLWELHQAKNRRKVQWYPLRSKPGKKEKERGQIEVEVQFMRNNMSASMFDLSMKEKSRSPFGKIKDKLKGKHRDGFSDTASAIVPSSNQFPDDSDEEMPEAEKKKFKLKTMFNKPGLKKNSISQSMSVLPTFQPPGQKTVLKPSDFSTDLNPPSASPASERRFPHIPAIMTHKRTASADTKQLNQISSNNKKEGLSLFSGMRSKNDPITRSNLCINGNHVYMEENEPRSDSPNDGSHDDSPQISRKTPLYASAENLSIPAKESINTSNNLQEKAVAGSSASESFKSMTLPAPQTIRPEESRSRSPPLVPDVPKEVKENKKQENKMSSLLSLVTGKKDSPKTIERESVPDRPLKNDKVKTTNGGGIAEPSFNGQNKASSNPFQEDEVDGPALQPPQPLEKNSKTSAVKPRLDVSSEAETKAKLSSSLTNATSAKDSPSGGLNAPFIKLDVEMSSQIKPSSGHVSDPSYDKERKSPIENSIPEAEDSLESAESPNAYEKPSMPLFWRSGVTQNKPSELKEVQVVAPFGEKIKSKKTYVKSLLDQITGKSPNTSPTDAVDVDLVKGILPVIHNSSLDHDMDTFLDHKQLSVNNDSVSRESDTVTACKDDWHVEPDAVDGKSVDFVANNAVEPPKPTPRTQSLPRKEPVADSKHMPPKPAPRSAPKVNKFPEPESKHEGSSPTSLVFGEPLEYFKTNEVPEQVSRFGTSGFNNAAHSGQSAASMKMSVQFTDDISYRLDELPVIPENPEGTSDDELLESKNDFLRDVSIIKTSDLPPVKEANTYSSTQTNGSPKSESDLDLVEKKSQEVTSITTDKPIDDISGGTMEKISSEVDESIRPSSPFLPLNSASNSALVASVTLSTANASTESQTNPTTDGSQKMENSGKKKLLRAWVSPSETQPIPTVQSGGALSSRLRTNPVKPMNTSQSKVSSSVSQPIKGYENDLNTMNTKIGSRVFFIEI